jgi:hypothetical protein
MIEIDGNAYSVPWRLIGETVLATVTDAAVCVQHAGRQVAMHAVLSGRRQRAIDPAHYAGIAAANRRCSVSPAIDPVAVAASTLLRPLGEYEALLGGGF